MPHTPETIKGHTIAPPRITAVGYWLACRYVLLPLVLGLLVLDVVLFLLFRYVLNSCYGVLCFL